MPISWPSADSAPGRPAPRWASRWAEQVPRRRRRLARLHAAVGGGHGPLRAGRRRADRPPERRHAARAPGGGGGGGRAGGVEHGGSLCPDRPRATIAVVATLVVTAAPTAIGQIAAILVGAAAGGGSARGARARRRRAPVGAGAARLAPAALTLFALLLIGLPVAAAVSPAPALAVADAFYRAGALVFGGGHVVLPLLHASVVEPGWVGEAAFLSGYGAAQAVPGPLFTFAAYLGAIMTEPPAGGRARHCAWSRSSCPACSSCWACCRSGRPSGARRSCRRACAG